MLNNGGGVYMAMKLDYSVIAFLVVVLILLMIAVALKAKATRFLKLIFQLVAGVFFLIIFNLGGNLFNISIPLNPITAFFAGIFQIPGIAFLLIVKYIIYT
jgi:inhibitor of the pro-sigma K processing machinery